MAVTLRLWLDQGVFRSCSLGSPGIGEVQFPRPVRPGDTLRVVTDIAELRLSASKPDEASPAYASHDNRHGEGSRAGTRVLSARCVQVSAGY